MTSHASSRPRACRVLDAAEPARGQRATRVFLSFPGLVCSYRSPSGRETGETVICAGSARRGRVAVAPSLRRADGYWDAARIDVYRRGLDGFEAFDTLAGALAGVTGWDVDHAVATRVAALGFGEGLWLVEAEPA